MEMTMASSCGMQGKLKASAAVQSSYWRFLAEKLPLDKESCHSSIPEVGDEEEEEEKEPSEEFNAVQSIDAVLHIVADNHKSHEAAQRRHSAPASGNYLKSSVSAPALGKNKSKNRWGQSSTESNVRHSPKVPSRFISSSTVSSLQSNATWSPQSPTSPSSSHVTSSQQAVSSADNDRLESLGLSDLRTTKPSYYGRLSTGTSASASGEAGTSSCRWSIPSTGSDSLFVPRRYHES